MLSGGSKWVSALPTGGSRWVSALPTGGSKWFRALPGQKVSLPNVTYSAASDHSS